MNNFRIFNLFMLVILFSLGACRDDVIDIETTRSQYTPTIIEGYTPKVSLVNSSVLGHITNENNENVAAATVTLGQHTAYTDEFGHFIIKDIAMNALGTYLEVTKEGYFKGSRRFYPVADRQSNVKITLLKKNAVATFNSGSGASVSPERGGSIYFPSNAIVDANNDAYEGQVVVFANWLSPSTPNIIGEMPGDLTAVNELNEEVALLTYGMMAVELETPDGLPLNLDANKSATLTFPVPDNIAGQAPSEIPLWYFNEHYGIWAIDGKATLQGNEYVGTVNHFTFWNCDVPFDVVNLDITVVDGNNNPLADHTVSLLMNGVNGASGNTDNLGFISGKVPANETLELRIYSHCNQTLHTQTIGPFADDTSLGTIAITSAGSNVSTTVTGNLINCDNNPVLNGVITAEFDGYTEYVYTDGTPFTFTFTTCNLGSPVTISGVDLDNAGQVITTTTTSGTTIDLGDFQACVTTPIENTITVTIDGTTYIYSNAMTNVGHVDSIGTDIWSDLGADIGVRFYIASTSTGSQTAYFQKVKNGDLGWDLSGNGPYTVEVTEIGSNPGDRVKGTFDGSLYDLSAGTPINVQLEFDITHQ